MLKGVYENTLGRLARWTASRETPEEALIRDAHRAYAKLIYDEPWYKFPFWAWAKRVWTEAPFFGQNFIRKIERKLFFTLEFGFKALYAKLIGFGAQTAYEPSDGLVIMHVRADAKTLGAIDERIKLLKDFGSRDLVITVPRWGAFTEIVPKMASHRVEFVEISGNDDILLSAIASNDANVKSVPMTFLFSSMVVAPEHRTRMVYAAKVAELVKALRLMPESKLQLEHIYDY